MVEGNVKNDKPTSDKELRWVASQDFDQFPMATPQKKMIKTYEDSKRIALGATLFLYIKFIINTASQKQGILLKELLPKDIKQFQISHIFDIEIQSYPTQRSVTTAPPANPNKAPPGPLVIRPVILVPRGCLKLHCSNYIHHLTTH